MKAINTMRLCFDSRSANESFARTAVAAFLCGLDPTVEELTDVKTAVSEAVTNCIVHGYREKIDKVYITANIYSDNRIVIKIKDKGCGIEDVKKAMEPLFTTRSRACRAGICCDGKPDGQGEGFLSAAKGHDGRAGKADCLQRRKQCTQQPRMNEAA